MDKHVSLSLLPEIACWLKKFFADIYSSRNFINHLMSDFLFCLRNFFFLILYRNNANFSVSLESHTWRQLILRVPKYYPSWDAQIFISTFRWGKSLSRLYNCNISFNSNSRTKTYIHTPKVSLLCIWIPFQEKKMK